MNEHLAFAVTADGSKTLFNSQIGEHYHSRHGALQESRHVFLDSGLKYFLGHEKVRARILEVGFGTGLNFLVSAEYCHVNNIQLHYTGIEAFPLSPEFIISTGYEQYVSLELWKSYIENYTGALNGEQAISAFCKLAIADTTLLKFESNTLFDVLFFDAFAAIHQPEMWDEQSLSHICKFIRPGGVFVTYAITGKLKRTMKGLGFVIEKAPGAPGKREMLRAVKI